MSHFDLITCLDLRDGLVFSRVVEVLFDRRVHTKTATSIFDYTHNANLALESLQQVRAPTNGLIASDFAEAKQPHSMLSLLWSLFFFFVGGSLGMMTCSIYLTFSF